MRNKLTIATAALLLASSGLATAQQPPAAPAAETPFKGSIDFGGRFSSVDGDQARFERFRDLRNGSVSRIIVGKETSRYVLDLKVDNIGYHDQRYEMNYDRNGKVKVGFLWDSTPSNYSYQSSTPWVEQSPGVFALDQTTRLAIQSSTPGVVGVPQNVSQLTAGSVYRSLAKPFDMQARRDAVGFTASVAPRKDLSFNVSFNSTKKSGYEPKGASTAFSYANQLPVPLDNRTNDISAAAEWIRPGGMVRVAWDGSWFNNNLRELVWDNPVRAADTNPIDASGYSNGRGAARSRMSLPPSNNLNTVSALGLYKMPAHSAVNAQISFTTMSQNDALIPWTSNEVITSQVPFFRTLPRNTAEAEVKGVNTVINYTTRPTRFFGFTMKYRYNDHRNRTPVFDGTEYVRMDAVPEETGGPTQQFNIRQNTFDVNGMFNVAPRTSVRIGYTLDDFKRTGREFSDSTDYTFRTTLDTVGNQYVMVRLIYEHAERVGTGFSEQSLEDGGFQPGLRTFDDSNRTRNRGWLVLTVTPTSILDFTFALAAGKDEFGGPGHELGLLDNKNTVYNFGANVSPTETVRLGANYGRDQYNTLQSSRNANPPGTDYGSWFDPNRTWFLNNDETVNNFSLYLDLIKPIAKTDIQVGYDFSDSNNAYIHSGPRITELSTNRALSGPSAIRYPGFAIPSPCAAGLTSCSERLPPITNNWHRFTVDLKYMFAEKVGLGLGYWYEKFDVSDYATIDESGRPGTPRIDYLGEISTGYGNRPYRGSTGFVRVLYLF